VREVCCPATRCAGNAIAAYQATEGNRPINKLHLIRIVRAHRIAKTLRARDWPNVSILILRSVVAENRRRLTVVVVCTNIYRVRRILFKLATCTMDSIQALNRTNEGYDSCRDLWKHVMLDAAQTKKALMARHLSSCQTNLLFFSRSRPTAPFLPLPCTFIVLVL
jgi:hypothetical protein